MGMYADGIGSVVLKRNLTLISVRFRRFLGNPHRFRELNSPAVALGLIILRYLLYKEREWMARKPQKELHRDGSCCVILRAAAGAVCGIGGDYGIIGLSCRAGIGNGACVRAAAASQHGGIGGGIEGLNQGAA